MRNIGTICIGIGAFILGYAVTYFSNNNPLPVAPDIHMETECDSFSTGVHLFNPDDRAIECSYRLYVDSNDNALLDSSDIFIGSEPSRRIGPKEEYKGMILRPLTRYKHYSLIVQAQTKDLITYYASIPCFPHSNEHEKHY